MIGTPRTRTEDSRAPAFVYSDVERLEFLAAASAILAESLENETTQANATRIAVPFLADWCVLHLREANQSVRRVSAVLSDRTSEPELRTLLDPKTYPARDGFSFQPECLPSIPAGWLDKLTADQAEVRVLLSFPCRSAMRTPLVLNGTCLGALTFLSAERIYSTKDLPLALDIGKRSAVAIGNARRYFSALSESRVSGRAGLVGNHEAFAVLNHELRNLLVPILGWSRIFRGHASVRRNAILCEGADSLERNARHMSRLVDDCLNMSRIVQEKIRLDRSVVDLNEIILSAAKGIHEAAREKQHSLRLDLYLSPLWVDGDRARLQQVVMNLLMNAVKYTDAGGRLCVTSRHLAQEAEVEISDSGNGIEAAQLDRIFEPFYQGTASSGSGLGLGLPISREILSLHQGRIWAESQGIGHGCTVRFRLPLTKPPESPGTALLSDRINPGRPRRILVVDDASDVRTLLKVQMEAMGHDVVAVSDAWSAIAYVRDHRPDLIVTDIRMAGLDGYSLVRMVRSELGTQAIPIVAVTGLSARGEIERVREAGFDACLCKPVEDEELNHWIQRLTRGRR